jgi:hypothetical protein
MECDNGVEGEASLESFLPAFESDASEFVGSAATALAFGAELFPPEKSFCEPGDVCTPPDARAEFEFSAAILVVILAPKASAPPTFVFAAGNGAAALVMPARDEGAEEMDTSFEDEGDVGDELSAVGEGALFAVMPRAEAVSRLSSFRLRIVLGSGCMPLSAGSDEIGSETTGLESGLVAESVPAADDESVGAEEYCCADPPSIARMIDSAIVSGGGAI